LPTDNEKDVFDSLVSKMDQAASSLTPEERALVHKMQPRVFEAVTPEKRAQIQAFLDAHAQYHPKSITMGAFAAASIVSNE